MRKRKGPTMRWVTIYHRVLAHEGFDETVELLLDLVQGAQKVSPGRPRRLYLDIEGHRNSAGGFDDDMRELQTEFMLGFFGEYLTEIHMPLGAWRKPGQRNDIPDVIQIKAPKQS